MKEKLFIVPPIEIPKTPPTTPRTPELSLSIKRTSGFTKTNIKTLPIKKSNLSPHVLT